MYLGGSQNPVSGAYNRDIDEVRIYNRALSAAEVTNLYNTESGLVAHYPFNGNANDESGNGNHGVVNGATITTDRHGNANSAYSFDGVDDYINLGNSAGLRFGGTKISTSAWININSIPPDNQGTILGQRDTGSPAKNNWQFHVSGTSVSAPLQSKLSFTTWELGHAAADPAIETVYSDILIPVQQWAHVVATYDGVNIRLYINGVLRITEPATAAIDTLDVPTLIGRFSLQDPKAFNGKIDEVRIYNRALSAAEVLSLYNTEKP